MPPKICLRMWVNKKQNTPVLGLEGRLGVKGIMSRASFMLVPECSRLSTLFYKDFAIPYITILILNSCAKWFPNCFGNHLVSARSFKWVLLLTGAGGSRDLGPAIGSPGHTEIRAGLQGGAHLLSSRGIGRVRRGCMRSRSISLTERRTPLHIFYLSV